MSDQDESIKYSGNKERRELLITYLVVVWPPPPRSATRRSYAWGWQSSDAPIDALHGPRKKKRRRASSHACVLHDEPAPACSSLLLPSSFLSPAVPSHCLEEANLGPPPTEKRDALRGRGGLTCGEGVHRR